MHGRVLAIILATVAVLRASDTGDYLNAKGCEARKSGDLVNAIHYFNKAIAIAPDSKFAYCNRGSVYSERGNYEHAIADFSKAVALDPDFSEVYTMRGSVHNLRGETDAALRDYDKAIETAPRSWKVYSGFNVSAVFARRGVVYESLGRTEEAVKDYDKAIELKDKDPLAYKRRGLLGLGRGDFGGAVRDFDAAIGRGEQGYVDFWRLLAGRGASAPDYDLAAAMRRWKKSTPWQKTIGQYLAGRLPEEAFLAAAQTGEDTVGQQCEAYFYAGMNHLCQHDESGARELLVRCVGCDRRNFVEYRVAQAQLARKQEGRSPVAAVGQSAK